MKEWHLEHAQKTIVKYVVGLPPNASSFERRNYKKYGSLVSVCKQIEYDMRHGVTRDEVLAAFSRVHSDSSFKYLVKSEDSMARLTEIQEHFKRPAIILRQWH